jgi:hypothetical protein
MKIMINSIVSSQLQTQRTVEQILKKSEETNVVQHPVAQQDDANSVLHSITQLAFKEAEDFLNFDDKIKKDGTFRKKLVRIILQTTF